VTPASIAIEYAILIFKVDTKNRLNVMKKYKSGSLKLNIKVETRRFSKSLGGLSRSSKRAVNDAV